MSRNSSLPRYQYRNERGNHRRNQLYKSPQDSLDRSLLGQGSAKHCTMRHGFATAVLAWCEQRILNEKNISQAKHGKDIMSFEQLQKNLHVIHQQQEKGPQKIWMTKSEIASHISHTMSPLISDVLAGKRPNQQIGQSSCIALYCFKKTVIPKIIIPLRRRMQ